MRIAIVSGHFMPEVGYQEVYIAKAYSRFGHQVRVFTSTSISPSGKKVVLHEYKPGLVKDVEYGFEMLRLKTTLKLRSNVLSLGLKQAVLDFKPDTVIIIALGKMFAGSLLSEEISSKTNLITIFGDAFEYRDRTTFVKRSLTFFQEIFFIFFKKRLYRKAVQFCKRIILNLPETETIFRFYLNDYEKQTFLNKRVHLSLGFDPDEFYFDATDRKNTRKKLNIKPDEVVLITSTRVNKRKNIENIIDIVSKMYAEGRKVKYIIIGFLGDNYEKELKAYISTQAHPSIFHCYPFLNHEEIRQFYCACDIGIWLKAAISIQEAMGTGLPIILENKPVVNHLIQDGINGWYFERGQLLRILEKSVLEIINKDIKSRIEDRKRIAKINSEKLSYNNIVQRIVEHM